MEPKYKRVLLKLSGEALAGDGHRYPCCRGGPPGLKALDA